MHRMYRGRVGHYSGHHAMLGTTSHRAFVSPHGKFSISVDDAGTSHVHLDNGEVAELTTNDDGSLSISITNKPAANGNGGNSNGVVHSEPQQNGCSVAVRVARQLVNRMSWERDPGDGSVRFTPDEGETLHVEGDAVQAVVSTEPVPAG